MQQEAISNLNMTDFRCMLASLTSVARVGVMPHDDGMRDPSTRVSNVINIFATSRRNPTSAPVALPLEGMTTRELEMHLQCRERARQDTGHALAKQTHPLMLTRIAKKLRNANEHDRALI